jgi:nicotinate-nucleotide adenylyltransferase
MHIALFGGAFDPPHLGHSQVSVSLLKVGLVDEVWFVPVYEHPWASRLGKKMLSYQDRLGMVRLVLQPGEKVAEYHSVSFTYDTLEYFAQQHPNWQFSWVMGSEYLGKFDDFLTGHPRLLDYHFFIYPRDGFAFEPLYDNMTALRDMEEIHISSSLVRQAVRDNQSIDGLVQPVIEQYIKEHNLGEFWLTNGK